MRTGRGIEDFETKCDKAKLNTESSPFLSPAGPAPLPPPACTLPRSYSLGVPSPFCSLYHPINLLAGTQVPIQSCPSVLGTSHPTLLDFQFPLPVPSHGSGLSSRDRCHPPHRHTPDPRVFPLPLFLSRPPSHRLPGSHPETPLTFNSSCFPHFHLGQKEGLSATARQEVPGLPPCLLTHCPTVPSWNPADRISATFLTSPKRQH